MWIESKPKWIMEISRAVDIRTSRRLRHSVYFSYSFVGIPFGFKHSFRCKTGFHNSILRRCKCSSVLIPASALDNLLGLVQRNLGLDK